MGRTRLIFEERYKIVVFLCFAVFLCIGIIIFRAYGVSCDEGAQRITGILALKYAVRGDQNLLIHENRDYGPVFEMFLVGIEATLNLTGNPRVVYLMRHLFTFLLFYAALFFFYLLCKYRFQSWKIGLLGCLFLIFSPRIFADSFYNVKDIPCLSLFIISIYTLTRYLDKKTPLRAFLHALICALLIDIRIAGIVVPFLTVIFFIIDILTTKQIKKRLKETIPGFLIYASFLIFFIILFWPTLWKNPLHNFLTAMRNMAHFRWDISVLYLGNYISNSKLPWHYIPVWIAITTPLSYTACFIIGCFVSARQFLRDPAQFYFSKKPDLIFILWFFLPLAAVAVSKPILYDGWRQMFFVYPAFLLLSLAGLIALFRFIKSKFQGLSYNFITIILIIFVATGLIDSAKFMLKYHPFQNLYFNILAGKNMQEVKNNFELDYWGLSCRKAMEYILKNDSDKAIKIYVADSIGTMNANILFPADSKRLVFVKNPDEAKYFLSTYRWHRGEYPYKDEYFSIKIGGAKIVVVYRFA